MTLAVALAGCHELWSRVDSPGASDEEALDRGPAGAHVLAADATVSRPRPKLELRAAPVVLDGVLRCLLTVSLPLQVGAARYRRSVEKSAFESGRQIAPPPALEVEIEACLRDLDAHIGADCGSDLARARDDYSAGLSDLAPVLADLSGYYRSLTYMDDGMQKSVALDKRFVGKLEPFAARDQTLREHVRRALWQDWQERADALRDRPLQRLTLQASSLVLAGLELLEALHRRDIAAAKKLLGALHVRERAFAIFVRKDLNRDREPAERQDAAHRLRGAVVKLGQQVRRLLGESVPSEAGVQAVEKTTFEIAQRAAELR